MRATPLGSLILVEEVYIETNDSQIPSILVYIVDFSYSEFDFFPTAYAKAHVLAQRCHTCPPIHPFFSPPSLPLSISFMKYLLSSSG